MIVTRAWLNEFIDLNEVTNEKLYETFNSIGLEVDSIDKITIPQKVVVGKIISCEKHPDADKLNVCQIDVGSEQLQIVCGAANVVDAKFVAVAKVGSVLPDNFHIKDAKLRGVESAGMVCASSELGLPDMGKGIMILDESLGELEVGKELNSYPNMADTIIELELTANRGDCLSVLGVARDLSAALNIEMKPFEYSKNETLNIANEAEITTNGTMDADLSYKLVTVESINSTFLIALRLAMVSVEAEGNLAQTLAYATHTTGVILRAYNSSSFTNEDEKIIVHVNAKNEGIVEVVGNGKTCSLVGASQSDESTANDKTKKLFFEASYINPDTLVEALANTKDKRDDLYYKTSRGSNPDLEFGLKFLAYVMDAYSDVNSYEGTLLVKVKREESKIVVDTKELSSIIGMDIDSTRVLTILKKLKFTVNETSNHTLDVTVPLFRHDIKHIQDISEEIVRIIGINNIEAKAISFKEKPRLNSTTDRYKAKKEFRNRAISAGFYENVSYVFSEKSLLEKYDFAVTATELELANPIAKELDTLRSTILVNLLNAAKRNVSYSQKSIPLFEIGAIFASQREQSEVISFIFSGEVESESVNNAGKPTNIDFAKFTQKLNAVVGAFELVPCSYENGLIHPYQSANIVVDGKVCGFLSKLHPTVQDSFDLPVTFVAELDFDALLPKHINATAISKFQGVYKDLSVVIDKSLNFFEVAKVLNALELPMLKESYPIDVYQDEKLGDKKSLTIRFFIQSMEKTLEDSDIESIMEKVMETLKTECHAELR